VAAQVCPPQLSACPPIANLGGGPPTHSPSALPTRASTSRTSVAARCAHWRNILTSQRLPHTRRVRALGASRRDRGTLRRMWHAPVALLFATVTVTCGTGVHTESTPGSGAEAESASGLRLCSWNIKKLGHGSSKNYAV